MASTSSTAPVDGTGQLSNRLPSTKALLVHEAIQCLLHTVVTGDALCADAMAALCRDRAAEVGTMQAPLAAALVRSAVEVVTRAMGAGDAAMGADALSTLRHLLACPSLRDVAVRASRLKSLAISVIEAASPSCDLIRASSASAAVLNVLREAGVDIAVAGSLDDGTTPLIAALLLSYLEPARVLLNAGADVNGLSRDGLLWPLCAAAVARSDAGMAWLLEHGASVTLTNKLGRTIAHMLVSAAVDNAASNPAAAAGFYSRWLRSIIAAEPSLLETRDSSSRTPLISACWTGLATSAATLLELGSDVAARNAAEDTALSVACSASSLPIVRLLIAKGAASAAALPPGSQQARMVASRALWSALCADWNCGECAVRCGGVRGGNCADGPDILRAVLAAGVREAVDPDGHSLAARCMGCTLQHADIPRGSVEHALTILQTLHASGVHVLAQGPADSLPILHSAAAEDAPAFVRWLVAVAGAPLEERESTRGCTPLLVACKSKAWAAAHELLDSGARVDVQSGDSDGWWPVLSVAAAPDCSATLLPRLLAADRDSLLRCAVGGLVALHLAASVNTLALKLLLSSGLPHLAESVNAVAVVIPTRDGPLQARMTPLHCTCGNARWEDALALLAADARVDITGYIDGRVQTIAAWARGSSACKHRGVKLAIAARAREHASLAGRAGAVSGRERPVLGSRGGITEEASAAPEICPAAVECTSGSGGTTAGAVADTKAELAVSETLVGGGVVAASRSADGTKKKVKGRKICIGAIRNRSEEGLFAAPALAVSASWVVDTADSRIPALDARAAAESAADGNGSRASNTCEEGSTAVATGVHCSSASETHVTSSAGNSPGDPSEKPAADRAAPTSVLGAPTQGVTAETSASTCNPGRATEVRFNSCESGAEFESGSNTCEPGEGATSAGAAARTARPRTAECGEGAGSAASIGAALFAVLQDETASVAAVRRHLTALSELARDPAAAGALRRLGARSAVSVALSRHGAAVAQAAAAVFTALSAAVEEGCGTEKAGSEM